MRKDKINYYLDIAQAVTERSTVGQQLKSGNYSAAEKMMDKYAGSLTKSQWNELADIYNKYGYELSKY